MKGQMDTEMGKIFVDEDVLAKYAGSAGGGLNWNKRS